MMFENMENLKIISSFHMRSKLVGKVQNRATHGFLFKIKGYTEYDFEDRTMRLSEGEVMFIPRGLSYRYTTNATGENLYTSINFQADIDSPEIRIYSLENFYGANYIYQSFSELWNFGGASDRYKCHSIFYDLVSYLTKIEELGSAEQRKDHLIDPAVAYLKQHLFDSTFKVNKLHRLCGISDTYFRKIFQLRFNMTPQEYVVTERIFRAKSMIESGDFETIREVSEQVGYHDPLYFSKAFKKVCGFSPSKLND